MPTRLLLEGPEIEALLARVSDEHGDAAQVEVAGVDTERLLLTVVVVGLDELRLGRTGDRIRAAVLRAQLTARLTRTQAP